MADLRERLTRIVARIDDNDSPASLIGAEAELVQIISEMSGNPAIELVMAIGFSFGMEEQRTGLYRSAEQRATARKLQRQLCQAILDRDADIAGVLMRRRSATMQQWIADLPSTGG